GWRRGWLLQRDVDQPADRVTLMADVDLKPLQKREAEPELNKRDRGERRQALARPHPGWSGHDPPEPCLAGVVAAPVGGHRAIDRATRDRAADCTDRSTEEPVTDDPRTSDRAGNAASDRSGRRRRAAAH